MKKIAALSGLVVAALLIWSGAAFAAESTHLLGYKVSASEVNSVVTPTIGRGGNTGISIYNSSPSYAVFIEVNGVATTSSVELPPSATLNLSDFSLSHIGVICNTAETATVYVYVTQP